MATKKQMKDYILKQKYEKAKREKKYWIEYERSIKNWKTGGYIIMVIIIALIIAAFASF